MSTSMRNFLDKGVEQMSWYDKLNQYFPVEEMKSKKHMEILLAEKKEVYHKDESADHVLMYVEFDSFIFIDYLWVSPKTRGQGLGHQLIEKLKKKNKPIILEVEPVDYSDSDTEKRLRFYQREEFAHAHTIGYTRRSLATGEENDLEILYWSPKNESEEEIFEQMKKIYQDIHTYKDEELYGEAYQPVDRVLTYDEESKRENILKK